MTVLFAKYINKNKGVVKKAVVGVAKAMNLTMNSNLRYTTSGVNAAMLDGKSCSSMNNYYNTDNSRMINHTNNSPKVLSRLRFIGRHGMRFCAINQIYKSL